MVKGVKHPEDRHTLRWGHRHENRTVLGEKRKMTATTYILASLKINTCRPQATAILSKQKFNGPSSIAPGGNTVMTKVLSVVFKRITFPSQSDRITKLCRVVRIVCGFIPCDWW